MRAYGFLDAEIGKENAFVKKSRSGFMAARVVGTPGDRCRTAQRAVRDPEDRRADADLPRLPLRHSDLRQRSAAGVARAISGADAAADGDERLR